MYTCIRASVCIRPRVWLTRVLFLYLPPCPTLCCNVLSFPPHCSVPLRQAREESGAGARRGKGEGGGANVETAQTQEALLQLRRLSIGAVYQKAAAGAACLTSASRSPSSWLVDVVPLAVSHKRCPDSVQLHSTPDEYC